jgi:hypothetical protein
MVDVIGMAMFVSGIGFKIDNFYNRSIPTINIVLMDGRSVYKYICIYIYIYIYTHIYTIPELNFSNQ